MRKTLILFIVLSLAFMCAGAASADQGSLTDAVRQYQGGQGGQAIAEEIDRVGSSIVGFARGIFGVAAVIFIMWAGVVFYGAGGDPNRIAMAKKLVAGFIVAMICIFSAEKIVGGLLGLFGYTL